MPVAHQNIFDLKTAKGNADNCRHLRFEECSNTRSLCADNVCTSMQQLCNGGPLRDTPPLCGPHLAPIPCIQRELEYVDCFRLISHRHFCPCLYTWCSNIGGVLHRNDKRFIFLSMRKKNQLQTELYIRKIVFLSKLIFLALIKVCREKFIRFEFCKCLRRLLNKAR